MASSLLTKLFSSALFSSLFFICMVPFLVSSHQFQVGGEGSWAKPTGNNSDPYNDWAAKDRFHIGDTIYFKYQRDSVLVVTKEDYENCVVSNPVSKFEDGNTIFEFDRYGFFYFISGEPGHCESGQKLIVRVMVQSETKPPETSPAPKGGGGAAEEGSGEDHGWDSHDFGPPGLYNSTTKLSVVSYFMTAVVAVFVIVYFFM